MNLRIAFVAIFLLCTSAILAQQNGDTNAIETDNTSGLRFNFDFRRTLVNKEVVGISGIRLGVPISNKVEVGLGVYSSNLFGILGTRVNKDYEDIRTDPVSIFPAEIGFSYFSAFGEYTLVHTDGLTLTTNTQYGLGWVDIDFTEPNVSKPSIRERKSLVEHSIKANVKVFEWLRVTGGVGYRYLIKAEPQVKRAFDAPIWITGVSIDFKKVFPKLFKRK